MTLSLENWAVGVGKNVTLPRENDDQGVGSSILSTDCFIKTTFYLGKMTTWM